jgi:hypothetical protein
VNRSPRTKRGKDHTRGKVERIKREDENRP